MKDKLRKYLLPNLPYLFFVYLFDKLCQAVRLAPGLDASEKLLHIGQGFQTAFASSAPSFHALDMSSLPLGLNRIKIERSLTTSALAVFVPFVTQELFMGGNAMYYGLNALSNNMILLDRKQSRCPNGLVFGTPGSGKSMSCKREITYVMLTTKDSRFR